MTIYKINSEVLLYSMGNYIQFLSEWAMETIVVIHRQNFFIISIWNSGHIEQTLPVPLPTQPSIISLLLSVSMNLPVLGTSQVELYSIYPFGVWLISLSVMSSKLSVLEHVSEFPSFLRLNNTLSYVYATFCLSIQVSMDPCVTSTFWLLGIMLQWTGVCQYQI